MYSLRIPGYLEALQGPPDLTGSKEDIARKLLFPDPDRDVHQIRKLPKDADCILEQTEVISKGRETRTEVNQIGRWSIGQLLPDGGGLLSMLFQ